MVEHDFNHLWNLQETFYQERPLMWVQNQNVLGLLERIKGEADECHEAITKCMVSSGYDNCVNLMTEDIRQEIADLLTFVMALGRCIGLTAPQLILDSIEKIGRNTARYAAIDWQDTTVNYDDQAEKSRGWDKRRKFSEQVYSMSV